MSVHNLVDVGTSQLLLCLAVLSSLDQVTTELGHNVSHIARSDS